MTRTACRITALLGAAALLTLTVANATAGRLGVNESSLRITWLSLEFETAFVTIRCRTTLEGSLHSGAIVKISRALIGSITRAIVGHPCINGEVWMDNGTEVEPLGVAPNRLPFHLTYESFSGSLPNISTVNLLLSRVSFVIQSTVLGLTCRGRYGRPEDNVTLVAAREGGGGITSITPPLATNRVAQVDQLGNAAVCPATGALRGRSNAPTTLSTGARLTVVLI